MIEQFNRENVKNIFSPQIQIFEPFGAHVDPSRTNMSSKQILQSVTSRMNDIPYILNKAYRDFTEIKSPYTMKAEKDGVLLCNKFNVLYILLHEDGEDRMAFEYIPPVRKIQAHALHLRYVREPGPFKAGDLLFDYTGQTECGLPKIGYRTKVMFGSFLGYTAEDAMVISESFSKRAQVDYYDKIYIPVTKKLKFIENEKGKFFYNVGECQGEKFLKYLKIDTSLNLDSQLVNATEENSRYYMKYIDGLEGAEIKEVKLHRINREPFQKLAKEYVYTPKLIQEISELYDSKYLEFLAMIEEYKKFSGPDVDIPSLINQIFLSYFSTSKLPSKLLSEVAERFGIMDKDIDYLLEVDICQTVPTVLGDKFANCFAGKGTISMIIPDHLMPNGVDLIFNPLGIYGRNNWGSIFELGLSKIIEDIQSSLQDKDSTFNKLQFVNEYFIKRTDIDYYIKVCDLLANFDNIYETFVLDVLKNKFYINVDNFPDFPYEQYFNEFIKPYADQFGIIVEKENYVFTKELQDWVINTRNYNLNGLEETMDTETVAYFGDAYYLKLFHTSNSKYNAVSIARTYNRANGQPAKGRKKQGGQHISWMSIAADLGHCDHPSVSKELTTVKSDCIDNKDQFVLDKIYTGKYSLKESGYDSKTNEMLNHNLAAMFGMKFVYVGEAVETSRATELERVAAIKTESKLVLKQSDFEKNFETIFNDFELNDLNLENIVKEDEKDYFDNIEGIK